MRKHRAGRSIKSFDICSLALLAVLTADRPAGGSIPSLPCHVFVRFVWGQEVNTVEAIWMKSPSEVDDAKYDEFYKFIAKAYDEPLAKVGRTVRIDRTVRSSVRS